jgi:hypothetical protein
VHLAIVEAVTTLRGGEGPWQSSIRYSTPGLFIVGRNPVSTDAVAIRVMGYTDPLASPGTPPFLLPDAGSGVIAADNHILLAHQAKLGTGDLSQIEVRGLTLEEAMAAADGGA